ncbi:hypothetical protein GNI_134280 [Gregarina niphandrodes]|uniref:Uncharacterized protein n=1 Tax=Gregarina niphandrodes TaxID=110365 RepID=A0A023B1A8_GRENI|nr:hypothetical protein GNI_134280 [Gregarina niphandrodes]EZG46254.1 hypothetical protein GNI_134280 [Gregarina niphandrodes]|eukprot:XP_011132324.1 hypothetical protein GNI_134280 [Gregarina niphandrodes]
MSSGSSEKEEDVYVESEYVLTAPTDNQTWMDWFIGCNPFAGRPAVEGQKDEGGGVMDEDDQRERMIRKFRPEVHEALQVLRDVPKRLRPRTTFTTPYRPVAGKRQISLLTGELDVDKIFTKVILAVPFNANLNIAYALFWGLTALKGYEFEHRSLVESRVAVLKFEGTRTNREPGEETSSGDKNGSATKESLSMLASMHPTLRLYKLIRSVVVKHVDDCVGDLTDILSAEEATEFHFVLLSSSTTTVLVAVDVDKRCSVFDAGSVSPTQKAVKYSLGGTPLRTPWADRYKIRDASVTSFEAADQVVSYIASLFAHDPIKSAGRTYLMWLLNTHGTYEEADAEEETNTKNETRQEHDEDVRHTFLNLERGGLH